MIFFNPQRYTYLEYCYIIQLVWQVIFYTILLCHISYYQLPCTTVQAKFTSLDEK